MAVTVLDLITGSVRPLSQLTGIAGNIVTFEMTAGSTRTLAAIIALPDTLKLFDMTSKASITYNQALAADGGSPIVTPVLPLNARLLHIGDSFNAIGASVNTLPVAVQYATNGRYRGGINWNLATGGTDTGQMSTDAKIASYIAYGADIVHFNGGTNDNKSEITASPSLANVDKITSQLFAAGVKAFVIDTVSPRFLGNALTPDQETWRLNYNAGLAARAASDPRIALADISAAGWVAADTLDGLHPNWRGRQKAQPFIASAFAKFSDNAGPVATRCADATNILRARGKLPDFLTGGGTLENTGSGTTTGDVANGWLVTNPSELAVVASRVDLSDGTFAQRLQISGTATTAARIQFRCTVTRTTPAVAGQTNEIMCHFKVGAGMQGVSALDLLTATAYDFTPGRSEIQVPPDAALPAFEGVLRTYAAGAYGTTGLTSLSTYFEVFIQPGTVSIDMQVDKFSAFLVTAQ